MHKFNIQYAKTLELFTFLKNYYVKITIFLTNTVFIGMKSHNYFKNKLNLCDYCAQLYTKGLESERFNGLSLTCSKTSANF